MESVIVNLKFQYPLVNYIVLYLEYLETQGFVVRVLGM